MNGKYAEMKGGIYVQETLDIHSNAGMLGGEIRLRPFAEVLREVQGYITRNYAETLKDDPEINALGRAIAGQLQITAQQIPTLA